MSLVPVPEVREMVAAARRFVAGEIHFSYMVGPVELCAFWARVHGAHPAIRALAEDWLRMLGRVWPEWGASMPGRVPLSVEEFRRRVAEDLGVALPTDHEAGESADTAG